MYGKQVAVLQYVLVEYWNQSCGQSFACLDTLVYPNNETNV